MEIRFSENKTVLIARIPVPLSGADLTGLKDTLYEHLRDSEMHGVIVDAAALDVIDSFTSRTLREIAATISVRGARAVIVGIPSDVAFAMAQLGVTLEGIPTAKNVEEALAYLRALSD